MIKIPQNSTKRSWLWLLIALSAATVSWFYMHRVLLPWEHYINVQPRGRFKAQLSDLYPRWVGTRDLLLYGKNPYSAEVSHEIQMGFYGHPIEQSYDKPPLEIYDEQRFAYPVYVVFLLAPTVHIPFESLDAWAPVILAAMTAITVCLWMGVLRWRPPPLQAAALIILVLSSPQIAQALRLRQPGLFVAFLVALGCWCVTRRQYLVAGVLLAVGTIKPHMVVLVLVWLGLWCIGEWRKRWLLAAGFGGSIAILTGAGELLVPGWPMYFLQAIDAYSKYFPITSLLRLILGNWVGGALSIVVLILLLVGAWRDRRVEADSPEFVHMLALSLLTTCFILPVLTPSNQVMLLLPLIALIRDWRELSKFWRWALAFFLAWPFVVSLVFLEYPPRVDSMRRWPLLPSVLALAVPFLILILYFTRRDARPGLEHGSRQSARASVS